MAFPSARRTPTSIGTIRILLIDENGVPENMGSRYDIQVLDENGQIIEIPWADGNLEPHLTPAQKSALVSFMQAMRTKATTEFLA